MTQEQIIKEVDNFLQDPVFGKLLNRNAAIALAQHFHDLALANQWIPVDDELPPHKPVGQNQRFSEKVFLRYQNGDCAEDSFDFEQPDTNITHWMPIPPLEGGEK